MGDARGPGGLLGRAAGARDYVLRTSGRQRLTIGAAAALLVTAPFGGLRAATGSGPDAIEPQEAFRVGPYDVTIRKVVTVGDLAPSITPEKPGGRLLALVGTVSNPGDRPEFATLLTRAFTVKRGDVVPPEGGRPGAQLISVDDGVSISTVNPGLTYDVAFVFEQESGWQRRPVTVDVEGYEFVQKDPLTLDADFWRAADEVASRGTFPVEVRR